MPLPMGTRAIAPPSSSGSAPCTSSRSSRRRRCAPHHEFHLRLAGDDKSEAFVQPARRIVPEHAEHDRLVGGCPFIEAQSQDLRSDALPLIAGSEVHLLE